MQQNQAPRIENLLGNPIGKAGRADSLVELGKVRALLLTRHKDSGKGAYRLEIDDR